MLRQKSNLQEAMSISATRADFGREGGTGAARTKTVTNNCTVRNADKPDALLRVISRELDGDA